MTEQLNMWANKQLLVMQKIWMSPVVVKYLKKFSLCDISTLEWHYVLHVQSMLYAGAERTGYYYIFHTVVVDDQHPNCPVGAVHNTQGCRSQYPLVPRTNTFFSISLKNTFSKCHQASKLIAMDSTMGVANCISLLHGACEGWETLAYKVLSSCLCFHTAQMHWHSELKKQGSFEKRPYYQLFHQLHKTPSKSPPTQKRFERVVHLQLERSAPTD